MITEFTIQHFKAFENVTATGLGRLNAFVGRNNAGKSTVLHALDLAGLAARWNDWSRFPLKLRIEDLFWDEGDFSLSLATEEGHNVKISARNRQSPVIQLGGAKKEELDSVLILPDPGYGLLNRRAITPAQAISAIENRNLANINSLDILQAIQFYAKKGERGLQPRDYADLLAQVRSFFPELESITSDRTEELIATLEYEENGRTFDILYSGTGLVRLLDVLIKVTISNAKLLLIDEPEFGMHPELQRRFLTFLGNLATEKDLQVFMATHSPVFLNTSADIEVFRLVNTGGCRRIVSVPSTLRHTVFGDLGIRPSDLFQNDICLMVEGQDDIVFFEYVLNELYQQEFRGLAVGVIQYGGKAAAGITTGALGVANVAGAQPYSYWIRDRDARPSDPPDAEAQTFVDALRKAGYGARILNKREIEYYIPENVYVEAQKGDPAKEEATRRGVHSDQSAKLRNLLGKEGCNIPRGASLRSLLKKHLTKDSLDAEIREIVESILVPWAKRIRGD